MASLNEVQLIGNTGIDPDIKQTSNGGKYAIFTFATTDKRKDAPDKLRVKSHNLARVKNFLPGKSWEIVKENKCPMRKFW